MPKRILALTLLATTSTLAHAQPDLAAPEPDAPAEPAPPPPEPAPAPPPTPPPVEHAPVVAPPAADIAPDPYESCLEVRRQIGKLIDVEPDRNQRGKLVRSMPDCEPLKPRAETATAPSSSTSEIALGVGVFSIAGISDTKLGGINLGVGGFVTRNLAISARLAGGTLFSGDTIGYVGLLAPHAQYWLGDHVWLGGGAGLGFIVLSASGDDALGLAGSGMDLRFGYSLGARGNSLNLSVEATSFSEGVSFAAPFNDRALTVLSFLVGYQQAPKRAPRPSMISRR